jgi:hypothetical protein
VVRLVPSDRLDELGEEEAAMHADVIRVRCEVAKRPVVGGHDRDRTRPARYVGRNAEYPCRPNCQRCRKGTPRKREGELWRHFDRHQLFDWEMRDGSWSAALSSDHFGSMTGKVFGYPETTVR